MRMASALKTIVSKKKRRYVEDGFNLDLSYINKRIIAMGFPAESVESLYRNSLDEVKRFLEQKHEDHYFIYNLCSERYYDVKKFHGRVATYPFDDHHPPDFASIKPFCDDVSGWLARDDKNVAVVHCKAGKGRTGVMICCYLLHSGRFPTAEAVLDYYGRQRTVDRKGVTIPSQRRYINYYSSVVSRALEYRPVKLYLRSLVVDPVPGFGNLPGGHEFYLQFEVRQNGGHERWESPEYAVRKGERQVRLQVDPPLLLCGDVKVEFSSKLKLLDNFGLIRTPQRLVQPKKEFHFWFNTFFVDSPFSSGLSYSVTSTNCAAATTTASPSCSMEEEAELEEELDDETTGSSSHEGIVMRDSLDSSDSGKLVMPANGTAIGGGAGAGSGVYQNHGLRSYPAPERHASCAGGGTVQPGGGAGISEDDAVSLLRLMKHTSVSDEHLLQDKKGGGSGQEASGVGTTAHQQHKHHLPVRLSHSHHLHQQQQHPQQLQHQQGHHPHIGVTSVQHQHHAMATSTTSSSSSSSSNSGAASATTLLSFNEIRKRHTSMPQTAARINPSKHSSAIFDQRQRLLEPPALADVPPGTPVSLRLDKCQVDKAFKDKQCKVYPDNFQVHLFLQKPHDQSDAGKLSSSPVCLKGSGDMAAARCMASACKNYNCNNAGGSCSSSEEDTTDSDALCGGGGGSGGGGGEGVGGRDERQQQLHFQQQQQQHQKPLFQSEWI